MIEVVKGNLNTYELFRDSGNVQLKRYNDDTKMWVTLSFKEDDNVELKDTLKGVLKKEYLNNFK